jgi:hypothetical protein
VKPDPTPAKEPSTKLGDFYRAHRPEVLGGIGVVVAGLAYWRSKHASASSSSASTIDPATGYPSGSAEDEAALAAANGAGVTAAPVGGYSSDGSEGSTGYSGSGYSGDGGNGSSIASALSGIQSSLTEDQTLLQGLGSSPVSSLPTNPTPTSPTVGRTNAQNEALTAKNLAADEAALKKSPTAKNKAAVKNLTTRLNKEKAA